jgi:hypothetical protein
MNPYRFLKFLHYQLFPHYEGVNVRNLSDAVVTVAIWWRQRLVLLHYIAETPLQTLVSS